MSTPSTDPRRTALGLRIRSLRQQQDRTQNDIAAAAGIHRGFYLRVEQGGNVGVDKLLRIADALRVDISQLFPPPPAVPARESASQPRLTDEDYRQRITEAATRVARLSTDLNTRLA